MVLLRALGFSQQTNYPIVFEAAYVTAQLLLDLAASLKHLKLKRVAKAIYVEDPAKPERPLAEGEPPRKPGHVCSFQCPLVAEESEEHNKSDLPNDDGAQGHHAPPHGQAGNHHSESPHKYKRHHPNIFGSPCSSPSSSSSSASGSPSERAPTRPRFAANLIDSESSDVSLNDSDEDEVREAKRLMKKLRVKAEHDHKSGQT